jgi:hypothetical protein
MFIFVATNTVRHGMLSQERRRAPKWVDYIDLHEPRLIAFLEYLSEDGTEVEYVQIHPGRCVIRAPCSGSGGCGDFVSRHSGGDYCHPDLRNATEQIMTTLRRSVGPDIQITILPTLLGGFSRR